MTQWAGACERFPQARTLSRTKTGPVAERILIVEDEPVLNQSLVHRLAREGYEVQGVRTADAARRALEEEWDLALVDIRLPDVEGLDFLAEVCRSRSPQVIAMTAYSALDDAVRAIKLGAQDYVKKPFEGGEILLRVRRALEAGALRREVASIRERSREGSGVGGLIGRTPAMQELREQVKRIAASATSTVLVTGESGTGKDMVARAIHHESARAARPFMTITCTAIPEQLLESELFGHERGSFTGAVTQKRGLLELADGGTVFLDEVGDLPLPLQAKLLRFLQEKTFRRVGGGRDITVDVRIVAATHQPLPARVAEGRFRQDLYYRLKVIDLLVPPLRDRRDDIALLAQAFLLDLSRGGLHSRVRTIEPEARARMVAYAWPGNVRELRNAVERAMILGTGEAIRCEDLPIELSTPRSCPPPDLGAARLETAPPGVDGAAGPPRLEVATAHDLYQLPREGVDLERLERELFTQAIALAKGNRTRAGRLLGLNRDQVRYRLEKYRLQDVRLHEPAPDAT